MPLLSAGFAEARPTLSVFRDLRGEGLGLTERFAGHLACMADIGRAVVFLLGVLLPFAAGVWAVRAAGAATGRLGHPQVPRSEPTVPLTQPRNDREMPREA